MTLLLRLLVASACWAVPPERTPAREFLEALELTEPARPRSPRQDGSSTARLRVGEPPSPGHRVLQVELANLKERTVSEFDLLYSPSGRLLAVFPVLPEDTLPKTEAGWAALRPRYFDLSPYYAAVPPPGSPGALQAWKEAALRQSEDRRIIGTFLEERYAKVSAAYGLFGDAPPPYRLHELDPATGSWDVHDFTPLAFSEAPPPFAAGSLTVEELAAKLSESRPGLKRVVIPTFPTVYALANLTPDELEYYRLVSATFELPPDPELLVVGPGTGVDTWMASLRTRKPVHVIGISPLEVANTRAAARFIGFPVRAIVGDNVADEAGELRFPGQRFDAVLWSMPAYRPNPFPEALPSSQMTLWDGDVGGPALRRLAAALPRLLKPGGRSLLWNFGPEGDGPDEVAEILRRAGGTADRMRVEVRRFKKGSGWFKGALYTVSHP